MPKVRKMRKRRRKTVGAVSRFNLRGGNGNSPPGPFTRDFHDDGNFHFDGSSGSSELMSEDRIQTPILHGDQQRISLDGICNSNAAVRAPPRPNDQNRKSVICPPIKDGFTFLHDPIEDYKDCYLCDERVKNSEYRAHLLQKCSPELATQVDLEKKKCLVCDRTMPQFSFKGLLRHNYKCLINKNVSLLGENNRICTNEAPKSGSVPVTMASQSAIGRDAGQVSAAVNDSPDSDVEIIKVISLISRPTLKLPTPRPTPLNVGSPKQRSRNSSNGSTGMESTEYSFQSRGSPDKDEEIITQGNRRSPQDEIDEGEKGDDAGISPQNSPDNSQVEIGNDDQGHEAEIPPQNSPGSSQDEISEDKEEEEDNAETPPAELRKRAVMKKITQFTSENITKILNKVRQRFMKSLDAYAALDKSSKTILETESHKLQNALWKLDPYSYEQLEIFEDWEELFLADEYPENGNRMWSNTVETFCFKILKVWDRVIVFANAGNYTNSEAATKIFRFAQIDPANITYKFLDIFEKTLSKDKDKGRHCGRRDRSK